MPTQIGLGIGVGTLATSYTASGVYTGPSGEVTVLTKGAQPIYFVTTDAERGRFSPAGYFKADPAGAYAFGGVGQQHEFRNGADGQEILFVSHTSATAPFGITVSYAIAPNNTSSFFYKGSDSGGNRFELRSNGGLANYSANNVSLSDARLKVALEPYSDTDLDALEASFLKVNWGRFKFTDQSHDDWNHGYTAQGIEAAFDGCAPELVDLCDLGPGGEHMAVYDTDLTHIALAVLARALKRIAALEAKLSPGRNHHAPPRPGRHGAP